MMSNNMAAGMSKIGEYGQCYMRVRQRIPMPEAGLPEHELQIVQIVRIARQMRMVQGWMQVSCWEPEQLQTPETKQVPTVRRGESPWQRWQGEERPEQRHHMRKSRMENMRN